MRRLLLRLSDTGEPVVSCSYGKGVLTLPSLPNPSNYKIGDPLYTIVLVVAAGCPVSRDAILWTNVPKDHKTEFKRDKFYKNIIKASFHKDDYIHIPIYHPGPYCYYISFRNDNDELQTTKKFYFVTPPVLTINDNFVQLNSISLQTVVSKWVDPSNWDPMFKKISRKGYNMIHFTPLQQRGESDSPYSIYDQLKFDPTFFNSSEDVSKMVSKLRYSYNILSLTDVVFNHTANNSSWLRDHPDAGYNQVTAPHLTPAIELDQQLLTFSVEMANLGYPCDMKNVDDLIRVMDGIKIHVLGSIRLWEYYVVNVTETLNSLKLSLDDKDSELPRFEKVGDDVVNDIVKLSKFVKDNAAVTPFDDTVFGTKFSKKLDSLKFAGILISFFPDYEKSDLLNKARDIVNEINLPLYKQYDDDVACILLQLYNRIKYLRLDPNGPQLGKVTFSSPLTEPYFTPVKSSKDGKTYYLANNGWIWNGNPLIDFASNKTKSYLRREVISWGDCVKLRYGSGPEDSPYLWERMAEYVKLNASIFDGFRIDNCHSTPIHVGEYFLDIARKVNPNLYVLAELFSGSEELDCLFVERLGINSLLREAMQAWSEEELSSLIHKYGGRPIGSYKYLPLDDYAYSTDFKLDEEYCEYLKTSNQIKCVSEIKMPKTLTATPPHALFMDCTHDNETPFQKRTVEDTLPNAALVSFCSSAVGSVYGYDEIFPYLLDVVNEKRKYSVKQDDGISDVKTLLNKIRKKIALETQDIEDSEMHIHHEGEYITFHRTNTRNGAGWFLIARSKFNDDVPYQAPPKIVLNSSICKFDFAYTLEIVGDVPQDTKFINGIETRLRPLSGLDINKIGDSDNVEIIIPDDFPAGSIAVFETKHIGVDKDLDTYLRSGVVKACRNLNLDSLNALLYRCEPEERDSSNGETGCYVIPNYGPIIYAGLQGWVSIFRNVIFNNDLAHPISEHLRNGQWALDYVCDRLNKYKNLDGVEEFQAWLISRMERIKRIPYYLIPTYFSLIVGVAYECCRFKCMQLLSPNIGKSTLFVQSLALASVQMVSKVYSASLLPDKSVSCLAAGLPHFSSGFMRCWGRDVFISLRGLLLTTGRFEYAKSHILAAAKTLKHGLIPNLLDSGRNPRYNARDAVWFFLQAIQDYVDIVPDGKSILKEKVTRRFPLDDEYIPIDSPKAFSYESSLEDIIYEIFSRHAKGIKYREANAGPNLDRVMKSDGFNVEVRVDWETGLVHGGSQSNCGTWMDKMGESEKAHSVGVPGTPRDGAAVEINGLLKSSLRFVRKLNKNGDFKYDHVLKSDGSKITFAEWDKLLQDNFERKFYVPMDPADDDKYDIDPKIVNRRGIYKDLYKSGKSYEDYQLRPNAMIALTVAPELFTPEFAIGAIEITDKVLRGPIGMKTLDPSDYNYRPYYNNGDDSDDFATAKGRNYHQGPEWVWCFGYFLRAYHFFYFNYNPKSQNRVKRKPSSYLYLQLYKRMDKHRKWIISSPWAGLTELTNKDGEECKDSSPSQAWSSACLLDLFFDLWSLYEEDV
ncbi:probable Glycogen debranching enzyme [Saccharomycodes ludwigii]|uniref:Glycogen debranching enzyme n=1 Tax=Saccharomycodes ludwigii TaxID=36035 RepID=A0A376B8M7_9ASCO|nr:probable Glycogen debranching enzyme [Saccharomycodes ludwigii]